MFSDCKEARYKCVLSNLRIIAKVEAASLTHLQHCKTCAEWLREHVTPFNQVAVELEALTRHEEYLSQFFSEEERQGGQQLLTHLTKHFTKKFDAMVDSLGKPYSTNVRVRLEKGELGKKN